MDERLEERLRRSAQTERTLGHYELEQMLLDAIDTITELRDESDCVGMAAYEVGYRNGSVHYELEHCPACKNVADLQEALAENSKLRELVRALLTCATEGECDECRMNGATPWHIGEAQLCDEVWEHLCKLGIEVRG